jgi:hypothetical protein
VDIKIQSKPFSKEPEGKDISVLEARVNTLRPSGSDAELAERFGGASPTGSTINK